MTASPQHQLISLRPDELKFVFELNKQSYCDLQVVNNTEHHVAFKVKTTSPKKYFVRPNTGVVQPWDSCVIRVTLQAQREAPPDMQCKDKFLIQSTIVPAHADVDELPADTFNKDTSGKRLEEFKIRVLYVAPSASGSADEALRNSAGNPELNPALQRVKDERDAAVHQAQQLQQELDLLKRRRYRKRDPGFSVTFAFAVGLIGLMVGFLMKLLSSSGPAPTTTG